MPVRRIQREFIHSHYLYTTDVIGLTERTDRSMQSQLSSSHVIDVPGGKRTWSIWEIFPYSTPYARERKYNLQSANTTVNDAKSRYIQKPGRTPPPVQPSRRKLCHSFLLFLPFHLWPTISITSHTTCPPPPQNPMISLQIPPAKSAPWGEWTSHESIR